MGSKTLSWSTAAAWVPLQLRALCLLVCSSTSAPCKHLVCLQSRSSHYLALQQPSPKCLSTVRAINYSFVPCEGRQPASVPAIGLGRCVSACKSYSAKEPRRIGRGFSPDAAFTALRIAITRRRLAVGVEQHRPVELSGWQLTGAAVYCRPRDLPVC